MGRTVGGLDGSGNANGDFCFTVCLGGFYLGISFDDGGLNGLTSLGRGDFDGTVRGGTCGIDQSFTLDVAEGGTQSDDRSGHGTDDLSCMVRVLGHEQHHECHDLGRQGEQELSTFELFQHEV